MICAVQSTKKIMQKFRRKFGRNFAIPKQKKCLSASVSPWRLLVINVEEEFIIINKENAKVVGIEMSNTVMSKTKIGSRTVR